MPFIYTFSFCAIIASIHENTIQLDHHNYLKQYSFHTLEWSAYVAVESKALAASTNGTNRQVHRLLSGYRLYTLI